MKQFVIFYFSNNICEGGGTGSGSGTSAREPQCTCSHPAVPTTTGGGQPPQQLNRQQRMLRESRSRAASNCSVNRNGNDFRILFLRCSLKKIQNNILTPFIAYLSLAPARGLTLQETFSNPVGHSLTLT